MKVLRGEWSGKTARITRAFIGGGSILVVGGQKLKLPGDFKTIKPLSVQEGRSTGQNLFIVLCAITLIGIPLAILLALLWRPVTATVGFRLNDGREFVAQMEKPEYTQLKPVLGLTESF